MREIPASVLRVAVPGDTFADALPHLQETYCGTIAYEIEHIAGHNRRVWLRQTIEWGAHRTALDPDQKRALLKRLSEVEALESYLHKAFLGKKQFSIEGLDVLVPMLDELIEEGADEGAREVVLGMAHRGRLNVLAHTVGRPYEAIIAEFEGEQSMAVDTAMPEGGTGDVKYHYGAAGTYRTQSGKGVTVTHVAEPEPPRVHQPGRRGPRPRRPDQPQGARPGARAVLGRAAAAARRRRVPRPGGGRGDAQPAGALRLLDRRHDPHHHEQPARVHDRPERRALDALRVGPREGLRRAGHPRQRGRRGGVHPRGPAGDGVPARVPPRRGDRPDRLPPLRPQRDRRARVHPAADVRQDQEAPAGAEDLRAEADRRGARHRGGGREAGRRGLPGARGRARRAARGDDAGPRHGRVRDRHRARARSRAPRSRPRRCGRSTSSCCGCRPASASTAS